MTHVIFFTNTETLEAKVKPEGTPTESRGALRTRGKFTGKWFAEGKGKRVNPGVSGPWARVKGRVCVGTLVRVNRLLGSNEGGTMD